MEERAFHGAFPMEEHAIWGSAADYELADEYGNYEQIGEQYDTFHKNFF